MVILHLIPLRLVDRLYFAIGEDELGPERAGEEITVPIGTVQQGVQKVKAGVRIRFVRCYKPDCPPMCRAEIIGQITGASDKG